MCSMCVFRASKRRTKRLRRDQGTTLGPAYDSDFGLTTGLAGVLGRTRCGFTASASAAVPPGIGISLLSRCWCWCRWRFRRHLRSNWRLLAHTVLTAALPLLGTANGSPSCGQLQ